MSIYVPEGQYTSADLLVLARAAKITERAKPCDPIRRRDRRDHGSRAKVCAAVAGRYESVEQIAAMTGLTEKQVRGVLNAPGMHFDKKKDSTGVNTYCVSNSVSPGAVE